jgi:hypothetical protein
MPSLSTILSVPTTLRTFQYLIKDAASAYLSHYSVWLNVGLRGREMRFPANPEVIKLSHASVTIHVPTADHS